MNRKITLNMKAMSKPLAIFLALILIVATFAGLWVSGVLPGILSVKPAATSSPSPQPSTTTTPSPTATTGEETKTSMTVEEKIANFVGNNSELSPLIPVFFQYLGRYFNGSSSDQIDQAVAGAMNNLTQSEKDVMRELVNSWNAHYSLIAPIIPDGYKFQSGETINPTTFANDVVQQARADNSFAKCADIAGYERYPEEGIAEEMGERVLIHYVNGYSEEYDPVEVQPGERIVLEGANFCDPNLQVIISGGGGYRRVLEGSDVYVVGDRTTAMTARLLDVKDWIYLDLPEDMSAGIYSITVHNISPQGIDDSRQIEIPPPSGQKYTIRATRIYCQDETNGFLGSEKGDDETIFGFKAYSGDQKCYPISTENHDYNDKTMVNLSPQEGSIFGPNYGAYAEIDGTVGIFVLGEEVDNGADLIWTEATIAAADSLAIAILAACSVATGWALVVGGIAGLLGIIARFLDGPVTIATDIMRWSADDLYYLTSENRPDWFTVDFVEKKEHPDIVQKTINMDGYDVVCDTYPISNGMEVRIPVGGTYEFLMNPSYSERLFTVWRGYQNFDEPSQYFVEFEVQRQG